MSDLPILYSFRRCPYAMRARLAVLASGERVELREIVLRDKPAEFLQASAKATVPVLVQNDGAVLEESLDVIDWALFKNDREGWLDFTSDEIEQMRLLIAECDGPFKAVLDAYKYASRNDGINANDERQKAERFLFDLDARLKGNAYLFGARFSLADAAILPFVRQFAHVDRDWFYAQDWPNLTIWLDAFLASDRFASIMQKYPKWQAGDAVTLFGSQITQ